MPDRPPERGNGEPAGELLEGGTGPSLWERLRTGLPPGARVLLAVVGIVVLVAGGSLWERERAAERELRQRVVLDSSIGVWSSSSMPRGGSVHYFLLVRNDGPRSLSVESLDASAEGLRVRLRGSTDRRVAAGAEVVLPLSVRLTCGGRPGGSGISRLDPQLTVGTEDGGSVAREVDPGAVAFLVDGVDALCRVRPGLTDHELSGPVLGGA